MEDEADAAVLVAALDQGLDADRVRHVVDHRVVAGVGDPEDRCEDAVLESRDVQGVDGAVTGGVGQLQRPPVAGHVHAGTAGRGRAGSRGIGSGGEGPAGPEGLDHLAEVRFGDYRDVEEEGFDAVSSIGLLEHIGVRNYPDYFTFLQGKLRVGGRMLNHCITRRDGSLSTKAGAFIDRYVFPDGELAPVGTIVTAMHDHGLEVRHVEDLREHYALTLRDWCRNLEQGWDDALGEVSLGVAKVWGLYMAGSRLAFERNEIGLHQVLGVKVGDDGDAQMPLRPTWGS